MKVWLIIIAIYSNVGLVDIKLYEHVGEKERCLQLLEMYEKGFKRLKGVEVDGYCHRK